MERARIALRSLLQHEAAGGVVLLIAAILALLVANSDLNQYYDHFFHEIDLGFGFGAVDLEKSVLLWINDGLMVIFFFLVGLEIKREFAEGELSTRSRALLPILAAIGGMVVPALIYWFINKDTPANMAGWAIPAATDIAFVIGVLAVLGNRVPASLRVLLTAIAVIDDLGAIIIIALFYGHGFQAWPFAIAAVAIAALFYLNRRGSSNLLAYSILALILWFAVLQSGIHATVAGVIAAMFVPARSPEGVPSPCRRLEAKIFLPVTFFILPLFAFANAGVPFKGMGLESFADPLTLGIIAGLFLGKQLGIFTVWFTAIKAGLAQKPEGVSWMQIYGLSILAGIGFTMSLFIGGLAFHDMHAQAEIRLGVLSGSLLSAIAGYLVLFIFSSQSTKKRIRTE